MPEICGRILTLVARLLPEDERDDWSREWNSELNFWWQNSGKDFAANRNVIRRSCLSILDVVAIRRLHPARTGTTMNIPMIEKITDDLRYSFRSLGRQPTLALAVLAILAVGIAANTVVFSIVQNVVLAPLPFPEPDDIVQVWPDRSRSLSKNTLVELQEQSTSYRSLAAWTESDFKLRKDGSAALIYGPEATAGFFEVLGLRPALGRLFQDGDDQPGANVVVLSHEFWTQEFGGDSSVVGNTINLNGIERVVVGVVEPGTDLLQKNAQVVVPSYLNQSAGANYLDIIGRLDDGVILDQARREFVGLVNGWGERDGRSPEWTVSANVTRLFDFIVGNIRTTLGLLMGAVSVTLLILVANVSSLLLARALARDKETAMRHALGAPVGRIMQMQITETALLAVVGGIVGVGIAGFALDMIGPAIADFMPRTIDVGLQGSVLAFAGTLIVIVGAAASLGPVLLTQKKSLGHVMHRGTAGRNGGRAQSFLVVAEVAAAAALVAGSSLLVKSMARTMDVDPGFEANALTYVSVDVGPDQWERPADLEDYYRRLTSRLEAIPGVIGAATIHAVPVLNSGWSMSLYPEGARPPAGTQPNFANWRPVTHNYFELSGMTFLSGSGFTEEMTQGSEPVAILNQAASQALFGNRSPVGELVMFPFDAGQQALRVIGVVADVRIRGLRSAAPMTIYRPFPQSTPALHRIGVHDRTIMIESQLPVSTLRLAIESALREHDPMANVARAQSMTNVIADSVAEQRMVAILMTGFAIVGLSLGALGIYGIMAFSVGQRIREISIRLALGAEGKTLAVRIVRQGLTLAIMGVMIGSGIAVYLSRFLTAQLYEVNRFDPASYLAAAGVLLSAAAISSFLPALRAARTDPMEVLK